MDALRFSTFDTRCIELIEKSTTACRGWHSLRSAFNHLKRGWALREVDLEMAAFRALTAEEEAASGVFHALKYRSYRNANLLNPRNHVHKNAMIPFLQILGTFFAEFSETESLSPKFHIKEEEGDTKLRIALSVVVGGQSMLAYPIPPLNFDVTTDGRRPSFKPQIQRFLTEKNSTSILSYVKQQANLRNRILYAGEKGYPALSELADTFFERRQRAVMAMAMAFLLIEPWSECQQFVQQSVDAFVAMLKGVEDKMLHSEL